MCYKNFKESDYSAKRIINRIKHKNKIKKVILNGEIYEDQRDRTIKVRENLVNVMLRSNDVVPQVRNSISFLQFSYFYNILYVHVVNIISIFLLYIHLVQERQYLVDEKMICIAIYRNKSILLQVR